MHEWRGHKRPTEDRKPSCFFGDRWEVHGASLTWRHEKRFSNVLPKIFHGFICLLAQSAIMNLEARLIREPARIFSHARKSRFSHEAPVSLLPFSAALSFDSPEAHQRTFFAVEFNFLSPCWGSDCALLLVGFGGVEGREPAVQGYRCSKESRQHKHDKLCLSRLLTEC